MYKSRTTLFKFVVVFFTRTARGKRRKGLVKKVVMPVFLTAVLMGAPILFGLVALAAFKGLWSGMTALGVTAALALRRLFAQNQHVYVPPHHVTEYLTDYKRNDYDNANRYGW
jgi:hypothetical protein